MESIYVSDYYEALPVKGRIADFCRPSVRLLSIPFRPISPEEKVVQSSNYRLLWPGYKRTGVRIQELGQTSLLTWTLPI